MDPQVAPSETVRAQTKEPVSLNQIFGHQFWIFLLVFGFGAASWIIRQLQEQARIRQAKERAKRQYEEQLRTGRSGGESAAIQSREPMLPRPDDLVARRQAQLQELRRRQAEGSPLAGAGMIVRTPSPPPRGMPTGGTPRSGRLSGTTPPPGVIIQRVPPGGGLPPPPRRSAPDQSRSRSGEPRPVSGESSLQQTRRNEQSQREALMRQAEIQDRARLDAERRRRLAQLAAEAREEELEVVELRDFGRSPFHTPDGALRSASEIRNLIIASEILNRPVGERQQEQ